MVLLRWLLAVMWVVAFLSGRALLNISTAVSDGANTVAARASRGSANPASDFQSPTVSREPRIDLYGNPIDEAMGDYRLDGRGDLYERHAPDTALLKLAPPSI